MRKLLCSVLGHKVVVDPWREWIGIWLRDASCARCGETLFTQHSHSERKPLDVY
jgi:hypothetical protein